MIAFKGFTKELTSAYGNRDKKTSTFKPGITLEVEKSKTAQSGFHCCENPCECLYLYPLGRSRFFRVEAGGDIDENERGHIACTKITLLHELTPKEFALEAMKYIINHPRRKMWQQSYESLVIEENYAETLQPQGIAIARGADPIVRGVCGSILGLIVDDGESITNAKLFTVTEADAGRWLRLAPDRTLKEVENFEEEAC